FCLRHTAPYHPKQLITYYCTQTDLNLDFLKEQLEHSIDLTQVDTLAPNIYSPSLYKQIHCENSEVRSLLTQYFYRSVMKKRKKL
ncbi:MAG: hypothetical protein OCD01_18805, partial [Fibrobacterales bacterium]